MRRLLLLAVVAATLAVPATAQEVRRGDLTLSRLQVRASLGNVPNTAAYLTIANRGRRPDRLLSASCTCARRTELHRTVDGGAMTRMAPALFVEVSAGGTATLAPGGYHLMLTGLERPLRDGQRVPLTLRFQRAGMVTAEFHVTSRPGGAEPARADGHAHH